MIAWYVHHHGRGHVTRLLAVRPHVADDVVVLSSLPEPDALPAATRWIRLPRSDRPESGVDPALLHPTAGGALHWAPVGHRGHADRMAAIASVLPLARAVVVDVSVEVTVLGRLLGRPVALFAQPGDRDDRPHALGRSLADAIIAPWPSTPADAPTGGLVEHVGGISRFEGRAVRRTRSASRVLALGGGATDEAWDSMLALAIAETPGWTWTVRGPRDWVDDPWDELTDADVVVTAAGQNAIADVAAARARIVVVPRPRPFDEQRATARRLIGAGLATPFDASESWSGMLRRASAARPDWSRWQVEGAARRAASIIERTAGIRA